MKKTRTSRTSSRPTTRRAPARRQGSAADQVLQALSRNILFRDVDPRVIRKSLSHFTQATIPAGDLIFDEQSRGRELYLLCSGRVRIKKYTKFGVESLLAILHPGDFFGELSLIDGLPRSARADAMDACEVLTLTADDFRDLVQQNRQVALNLLHNLAVRLRTMDQTFVMELGRNTLASRNKLDKLNLLIEASKIVNSTLDIDALLGLIMEVATRSIGADRGTLYLVDRRTDELWSKVTQGSGMVEIRLPMGKGLAGYVARTGELVNITDAYKDPRFNPEVDRRSGYATQTVLCMPMRNREGVVIGVFQLLNKRTGHFGPEDEAFIDALSVHAAIALENARLARDMALNEQLSAVGGMAASILHDIRSPITTLRLYADIIRRGTGDRDPAELAGEMVRQIDRLNTMAQEILDFARGVTEVTIEPVEIGPAMEILLRLVDTEIAPRTIRLVRDLQYTGTCSLDTNKLSRAVQNLVNNAADAMPDGGTLTVRTRAEGGMLVIEVADTGTGIPDDVRSQIFEPFFTHGKKHGTGLGLAIVRKIMDDHSGRVEVVSREGKGSIFRLFFPLS